MSVESAAESPATPGNTPGARPVAEAGARPVSAAGLARTGLVLAGPALLLASELAAVRWPGGLSPREQGAFLLAHVDRFTLSYLLGMLAAAGLVGGYVVAAGALTGRGAGLARAAAVAGVLGSLGLVGHMTLGLAKRDLLVADPSAWAAAEDADGGLAAVVTLVPTILGPELGIVLLGFALWRGRWAGRGVAAVAVVAVLADLSGTSYNTVIYAVCALAVFGVVARGLAGQGAGPPPVRPH